MTRPEPASRRFLDLLPPELCADLDIVCAPLIAIAPVQSAISLTGRAGLIFTSANGVDVAKDMNVPAGCVAYCVGRATTACAIDAGWTANYAGATADELITTIQAAGVRHLLHLRGEHARGDIAGCLTKAGLDCAEQIIYRQPVLPLGPKARALIDRQAHVIVPLFSPRTAQQFAEACESAAKMHIVALSLAVTEPLKLLHHGDLRICREPTALAMAETVREVAAGLIRVETDRPAQ